MEPELAGPRWKRRQESRRREEEAMKASIFKMVGVFTLVLGAFSMPHETAARSSQKAPESTGMTFFGPTPTQSVRNVPVVLFNCPRNKKC
jgi:hypothetical protein